MSVKDIDKKQIRCSFCGKTQDEVGQLVEGPGVYICDQCVELCEGIIADMAEENRNYAGVDEVREALNRSLDDGVLTALRFTVRYNMDRFKLLHPETLKVWNSILEDKEKK